MTETAAEFVERMTSRWHSKKNKLIGDIDMAHLLDLARRGAAVTDHERKQRAFMGDPLKGVTLPPPPAGEPSDE